MSRNLLGRLLTASAAFALAACGGGNSGTIAFVPPPPPPPPPSSPTIFPNITTNTDFAALGLQLSGNELVKNGFGVKFDAASNEYIIGLPTQVDSFTSDNQNNSFWFGHLGQGGTFISVFRPSANNPEIQLSYTSFGVGHSISNVDYYSTVLSFIAFGSATPASGIPLSGSATYNALVAGNTVDNTGSIGGSASPQYTGSISGTATLQFNFGAGTLAGQLDPILTYNNVATNLGTYNFVNTVFGAGSTDFSGQLSHVGTNTLGTFDGQFTGPAAQELMARWTAPYLNPTTQQWSNMFGIWVGKQK